MAALASGYVQARAVVRLEPGPGRKVRLRLGGFVRTIGRDRREMAWVSAGRYSRGSDSRRIRAGLDHCLRLMRGRCKAAWFANERPRRRYRLAGFWIDRSEVTVAAWRGCAATGGCRALPAKSGAADRLPVTGVSWIEAGKYCAWAGKRLPTEEEWEAAAAGPEGRLYPWGARWLERVARHAPGGSFRGRKGPPAGAARGGPAGPSPVGSHPQGASPFRVWDLAGNVEEWVSDCFVGRLPAAKAEDLRLDKGAATGGRKAEPIKEPGGAEPARGSAAAGSCLARVVKGGSWASPPWDLRTTHRKGVPPTARTVTLGFRCARDGGR